MHSKTNHAHPSFDVPIIGQQPTTITYEELSDEFKKWKTDKQLIELAKGVKPIFPLILVDFFSITKKSSLLNMDITEPLLYDKFYPFVKLLVDINTKDMIVKAGTVFKCLSSFFDMQYIPPAPGSNQPSSEVMTMDLKQYLFNLVYDKKAKEIALDKNVRIIAYHQLTAEYEGCI